MSWTFTISGNAVQKAGAGHAVIFDQLSGNNIMTTWSDLTEGMIVAKTRKDYLNSYSSLPTDIKNMLNEITSSAIAKRIVAYKQSGYPIIGEATTLINILDDDVRQGIETLKDFKANDIKDI